MNKPVNWDLLRDAVREAVALDLREAANSPEWVSGAELVALYADLRSAAPLPLRIRLYLLNRHELLASLQVALAEGGELATVRQGELTPEYWPSSRIVTSLDPAGWWLQANQYLDQLSDHLSDTRRTGPSELEERAEPVQTEEDDEGVELRHLFLSRLRLELESAIDSLETAGVFRTLAEESGVGRIAAFVHVDPQDAVETEIRLARRYPDYRPAITAFLMSRVWGTGLCTRCRKKCGGKNQGKCAVCKELVCRRCWEAHAHPEVVGPIPFFHEPKP